MFAKGRIGKHGGHSWQSRDTMHINCQATGCMYNIVKTCRVPSICKINDKGQCEGFKAKELPKTLDGD